MEHPNYNDDYRRLPSPTIPLLYHQVAHSVVNFGMFYARAAVRTR